MAPTPISATHRIRFSMVNTTLTRNFDVFTNAIVNVASAIGYDLVSKHSGLGNPHAEDAIDRLWTLYAPVYNPAHVAFGAAELQLYDPGSGAYATIATWGTAVSPSGSGALSPGFQGIFMYYDLDHLKLQLRLPEPDNAQMRRDTTHSNIPGSLQPIDTSIINPTSATDLGNWMTGRANLRVLNLISEILGPNRKYRRSRGIA